MKAEPFVVSPETYPPALHVLGVNITVLASNARTRCYEITLQAGEEGVGPPPHRHDWDESFYVLRGSVEMTIEGRANQCTPGMLVHVWRDGRGLVTHLDFIGDFEVGEFSDQHTHTPASMSAGAAP